MTTTCQCLIRRWMIHRSASAKMHRILGCGALRRSRRGKSLIILFKCMPLRQCALAIFWFLFCSDLWPFGFSINTTARTKEDVPFRRFMLLQGTAFRKIWGEKIKMTSTELRVFFILSALCCVSADLPCNISVGLENGDLPNHLMNASSNRHGHHAHLGRLNNKIRKIVNEGKTVWGAWCAKDRDINQYLQVDLQVVHNVTGVATQGYSYGAMVKSYQIMYSFNGRQWFQYKENGTIKTFKGNEDSDTIVRHKFSRRLNARFIRFNPRTWENMICMRVEIYACEVAKPEPTTVAPTTNEIPTTGKNIPSIKITELLVTDVEATKETEPKESSITTITEDPTQLDKRKNVGNLNFCSVQLVIACILLVFINVVN